MYDIGNLLVVVGSILGSFKSHTLSTIEAKGIKFLNFGIGVFIGSSMAFHYLGEVGMWLGAVIALVTSSLSVASIDALFKITPVIIPKLMEKYLGIEDSDNKENDK